MSHEATTWAIRQKGLAPVAKLILWHLADRFHPDHGCFPNQKTLCEDVEIARDTLNRHLDELEKTGLIAREARVDEATKRQLSTRYRFAFERGFRPAKSAIESAAAAGETGAETPAETAPETACEAVEKDESRVRISDTAPPEPCPISAPSRVRLIGHGYKAEPVSEPVRDEKKGAGASAGADAQAFEGFWADWLRLVPTGVSDSRPRALQAWQALGLDDRAEAARLLERWVAACRAARRNWQAPASSSYLADMAWRNLNPPPGATAGPPLKQASAFTAEWWGEFWLRIERGERLAFMLTQAERGAGFAVRPEAIEASRRLKPCPNDGATWPLWRDWLRERGHRMPAFREGKVWLYLPGAAPPGDGGGVWTGFPDGKAEQAA